MRPIWCIAALLTLASAPTPARAHRVEGVVAEPCFTLSGPQDCALTAVAEINQAQRQLLVEAYNFTEPRIIAAIDAAARRGVAVTLVLDKISPNQPCTGADRLRASGIPIYIDAAPRIAHNKVMIIDEATVITGSFNFSISAATVNAENLIVLRSSDLAAAYAANFARRLAASSPWDGSHRAPVRACHTQSEAG